MKQESLMPKPRIALQIGITGHRFNKIADDKRAAIEQALRSLYTMIDEAVAALVRETQGGIYSNDVPLMRIVSGLADGTDRLAVTTAPRCWQIEALLPMPRAEYVRDFSGPNAPERSRDEFEALLASAASVTELPLISGVNVRDDEGRAQHYQVLGEFLIRQIDLLVAVWDGGQAAGPGGTASVVARAFEQGRPVFWIDSDDPGQLRRIVGLDAASYSDHHWQDVDAAVLEGVLRAILLPPPMPVSSHEEHRGAHGTALAVSRTQLPSYFRMGWPKPMRWPLAYNLLRLLAGAGRWSWPIKYPSYDDHARSWDGFFSAVEDTKGLDAFNDRIRSILLPRSIWADALAWRYGHIYRSAYVSIFLLAGLCVPVGLCYLFFLESPAVLDIKAAFVVVELLIISAVVLVVRRGVRLHWHAVWLETRELSELLRLGRSLSYIGALRDFVTAPHATGQETFASWYVRAAFREIGLPSAVLDAAYLKHVLKAALTTEIEEQKSYHAANAKNLGKIHHFLHHNGDACFAATMYMLLIYLAAWGVDHLVAAAHAAEHAAAASHGWLHELLEYVIKPIVSIAAAGLPAFGAALSGIRAQGDFEGFAQRSVATHRELTDVERQIGALLSSPDPITLNSATDVLMAAALAMGADVRAWHALYVSKRLTLPA